MNALLQNLYLFKQLDAESLQLINDISTLKNYAEGDEIFRQGTDAESLFVIQHGIVRIEQEISDGSRIEVATLATGSHFGEVAFLDKHERSGTATAVTSSDIVVIGFEPLQELLDSHTEIAVHVYRELARFLSSRLRLTTLDLTYSKAQNISHF